MRFSLRTLFLVMLLAGPLSAYGWSKYLSYVERQEQARLATLQRVALRRPQPPRPFPQFCGYKPPLETEMQLISEELVEFQQSLAAGE